MLPLLLDASRQSVFQHESRAGHAVVEAQGIHPPFIYNVVHRRPVVGIGTGRESGHDLLKQAHAFEMAEQKP